MTPERDGLVGRWDPAVLLRAALELGPSSLALYAAYRLSIVTGLARRQTPLARWGARPARAWLQNGIPSEPQGYLEHRRVRSSAHPFLFDPDDGLAPRLRDVMRDTGPVLAEADAVLEGDFRLFGEHRVRLGFPPDWAIPADIEETGAGEAFDLRRHWTESERVPGGRDVKLAWEVSRFGWTFPLVRAACITGERRYADGFWTLLESWKAANQPNSGVNWISGQEVALRLMAVVFAAYGFASFWADAPERMFGLAEFIAVHAARIPPTMSYARAQGNNHLITEATALYTVGLLFPELRHARRWRRSGRTWLVRALRRQIFDDGGYIQQSTNYHRLALEVAMWAARLGSLNRDPLPDDCLEALGRSVACLEALVDPATGEAPNFGPNDGAQFLPLSSQPFRDYRPVVQAASLTFRYRVVYPPGPWDEPFVWLGLKAESRVGEAAIAQGGDSFPDAGLHLIRGVRTKAILRCGRFASRPGHSDQLHFDLWRDGRNVARDPGTYRYLADVPWDNALAQARVHNTVTVAGQEPMERAGRFLWLNWDQGRLLGRWRTADGMLEMVTAERQGYRDVGISHMRTVVRAGDDLWLVVDDLTRWPAGRASGIISPPVAVAAWCLPDWLFALDGRLLTVEVPGEAQPLRVEPSAGKPGLYRAGQLVAGTRIQPELPVWGWWSKTYGLKEPSLFLAVEIGGGLPLRLSTWWYFGSSDPAMLKLGWVEPRPGVLPLAWLSYQGLRLEL
ncbi:MAG TPA: alginate lyase family protein [Anaerolineales bacterium]|nr:alginate lyase family protein [Anaerolineales bacterium]